MQCMVCWGHSNFETIIRIGLLVTNFGQNKNLISSRTIDNDYDGDDEMENEMCDGIIA